MADVLPLRGEYMSNMIQEFQLARQPAGARPDVAENIAIRLGELLDELVESNDIVKASELAVLKLEGHPTINAYKTVLKAEIWF